jgi:exopolysaccharide biosynthesis predicted pyruvyltransferase EpsI
VLRRSAMSNTGDSVGDKSPFTLFLEAVHDKKIYFEPLWGNNGDRLILKGAQEVLGKTHSNLVEDPETADLILINGGGGMNEIWPLGLGRLEFYRMRYPKLPIVVGPSTYRFSSDRFNKICEINHTPLILFARDYISADIVKKRNPPSNVEVKISQDLVFEIQDSSFIENILKECKEKHVLVSMRTDCSASSVGILSKVKGKWVPKRLRRPLSWVRDRLVSLKSRSSIKTIIDREGIPRNIPRIYRDVAVVIGFDEFVDMIRDAALIITDRLHVGILGHILNKRTILLPDGYDKIKGVFEMSMSGPNSRTTFLGSGVVSIKQVSVLFDSVHYSI